MIEFLMNAQPLAEILLGAAIDHVIREGPHEEGHIDGGTRADAGADSRFAATDFRVVLHIVSRTRDAA